MQGEVTPVTNDSPHRRRSGARRAKRMLRRAARWLGWDPRRHVLAEIRPGDVCAEIGVLRGDFSQRILARRPKQLHLIDPWRFFPEYADRSYGVREGNDQARMDALCKGVRARFRDRSEVVIHRKGSEEAAREIPDDSLDFVYVDANHDYAFVRRDLAAYLPKLKRGGTLAGDDYEFKRCPDGGPRRAVEELVASGGAVLVSVLNNQFILRKP